MPTARTTRSTGKRRSAKPLKTDNPAPVLPSPPVSPKRVSQRERSSRLSAKICDDTPLAIAFRSIPGGWRNYIEYVDIAARNGDRDCTKFVAAWQALTPRERKAHAPEQLCELTSMKPSDLVAAVCGALWESKTAEASLVSAIALPKTLEATAKFARRADGNRDRELLLRATGSLPDKKGTTINYDQRSQTVVAAGGGMPSLAGSPGGLARIAAGELPDMDAEVLSNSRLIAPPEQSEGGAEEIADAEFEDEDESDD